MKISQFFLFFAFFVLLVFFSFLATYKNLDPDFGWHFRTGQLILERGVPYQDWYSYTMPNFPWIDHEWLTDVLIYKIYSYFGGNFLLLIFLFIYTLSFFIIKNQNYNFKFFIFATSLGYLTTLGLLGIRPQLLTIFFIAILWKILSNFLENSSKFIYPVRNQIHKQIGSYFWRPISNGVYFLPFLFLFWANLHAGFFAGLFILSIILFLEIFKKFRFGPRFKILSFLNNFSFNEQTTTKI